MLKANCRKKALLIVFLVSIVGNLAAGETFRFTVSCDNRPSQPENIPRWEWLLDEMSAKVIDEGVFHIITGDFDEPEYTDASLKLQFGEDVVWYPVVGNHEIGPSAGGGRPGPPGPPRPPGNEPDIPAPVDTPAHMEWIRNAYYSLPYIVNEGPAGCETTTYSWDYGNAHFIAINEYYDGLSDTGTDGDVVDELYYWLVADLEANTKPAIFIFGHEPAYPEYRHVGDSLDQYPAHRDRFWKLLNDKQVIAYFCGHTHWYYAKQVDGDWVAFTWQIDVGNAGNIAEPAQTFVDVTVTDADVTFNIWQGTEGVPFTIVETWTVDIPVPPYKAYKPDPADGAVHLGTLLSLNWRMGAGAASHDVYFGENFDDVNDGTGGAFRGNQVATTYEPGTLLDNTTYYWRIDEVNDMDPNSPWKGDVWTFTVTESIVVDDFEDYDAADNQIWYVWKDGIVHGRRGVPPYWPGNGTGSVVGDNTTASYTEETIVHGGRQAMPYSYDNNKQGYLKYSEAERTLSYPRDWTEADVATLRLWFYGGPANAPEPMYVAVANITGQPAVVYHPDTNAALIDTWTEWDIPLTEFGNQGVVLTDVNTISIGFGDRNNPQPGGSGKVYFDDIQLRLPSPTPE